MLEHFLIGVVIFLLIVLIFILLKKSNSTINDAQLNDHHRKILLDFNESLNKATDRFNKLVSEEFKYNRDVLESLKINQQESINQLKAEVVEKINLALSNQAKIQQDSIQSSLKNTTIQLLASVEALTKSVD